MRNPDNRRPALRRARPISTDPLRGAWLALLVCAAMALVACGDDSTAINQAPVLTLDVGAQETYVIGDMIQIRATADDPDADPLTFSVEGLPERADLQTFPNSALMSWDPIASDVTEGSEGRRLIFVVEDDRGGRAERVVNLTILAGNGAPVFESPSSKLFTPRSGQQLSFEVKVRDDDSNEVHLSMPADTAPEGASFEQTDQKTGTFRWTPNPAQLARRVHSATFVAQDNQGLPVKQKVTIILQSSTGGGGGGNDPSGPAPAPGDSCDDQLITHAAPGAQRTLDDYELEAYLSPTAADKYDKGFLFWTTENPMKYDVDLEAIDMKVGQGLMRAGIPNLLLSAGESEVVYYTICAEDSTGDPAADDTFVCAPASYYYSFVAYSPDSNICIDDADAGTSFASATTASPTDWETYRTCQGAADYHKVSVSAGELAEVYITYSLTDTPGSHALTHPMEITVYDDAHNPLPDATLTAECSGIVYIDLQAGASATTWYIKVAPKQGAEMPYQMTAFHSDDSGPDEPIEACQDNDHFGSTNRAPSEAPLVDDGEYTGLTVCGGADAADWYSNILGVGDAAYVELLVEEGADLEDVFFAAYTSGGALASLSTRDGDALYIEFEAMREDFYHYIVEAPVDTRYTLLFITY